MFAAHHCCWEVSKKGGEAHKVKVNVNVNVQVNVPVPVDVNVNVNVIGVPVCRTPRDRALRIRK